MASSIHLLSPLGVLIIILFISAECKGDEVDLQRRVEHLEKVVGLLEESLNSTIENERIDKEYWMKQKVKLETKLQWALTVGPKGMSKVTSKFVMLLASRVFKDGIVTDLRPLAQIHSKESPTLYRDCHEAKEKGWMWSGLYTIITSNNSHQDVYCEMAHDGGGWTFRPDHRGMKDFRPLPNTKTPKVYKDCYSAYKNGWMWSGVYKISPAMDEIDVYCDQEQDGGGWTIIQRRSTGTTDFKKPWENFKSGFGDITRDFWLGNKNLHEITKKGNQELKITFRMRRPGRLNIDVRVPSFKVLDESYGYMILTGPITQSSGPQSLKVSDILINATRFSTVDRDNDGTRGNCGERFGAWWYAHVCNNNPNSYYVRYFFTGGGLFTQMKIRPTEI